MPELRAWSIVLRHAYVVLSSFLLLHSASCSDAQPEKSPASPSTAETQVGDRPPALSEGTQVSVESVDALRALGYVGFDDEEADLELTGVMHFEPEHSWPGYNLVSNHRLSSADLFTARGEIVARWGLPKSRSWNHCQLLENGDLLVIGTDDTGVRERQSKDKFLALFSFDGKLKWKRQVPVHHDVDPSRPGQLLALTEDLRVIPDVDPALPVDDHLLTLLSEKAVVLDEKSLYEFLKAGPFPFEFQKVAPRKKGDRWEIDLFHANSVAWMPHPSLQARGSLYDPGNVLVSIRHQDSIAILNWERGQLLWAWGQGELSGPHDATWLANGNILVFDNGMNRSWSRVIEIDPQRSKIVWQYPSEAEEFYTLRMGSSERLPNGNTLIAESDRGHAFEVTPDGRKTWEFWSPYFNEKGQRATIVRVRRYSETSVASWREATAHKSRD